MLEGILNQVSSSHLIVITKREQVAEIRGKAVFGVRDVALIPLASQSEAQNTLDGLVGTNQPPPNDGGGTDTELSDVGEDAEETDGRVEDKPPEAAAVEPPKGGLAKSTTFTKNVIQERGQYGRFAASWFSKNGSSASVRRKQGMSSDQNPSSPPGDSALSADSKDDKAAAENKAPEGERAIDSLGPRIQRTARLYFSSSGFYFSYGLDLSRTLGRSNASTSESSLWRQFDSMVSRFLLRCSNPV